uniref:Chemokine interleukin-8-like domain-containing protein n=1 Tax=Neolamprologus brichardi TaxID=32507 RepID=A0A3Q4N169_NEOBR
MLPIRAVVVMIALTVCLTANKSAGYITGRLPYSAIKGYSVQTDTEMCPINAIMFILTNCLKEISVYCGCTNIYILLFLM